MLDWLIFLPVCESLYTSEIDDEAAIGFLDTAALTIFSYFFFNTLPGLFNNFLADLQTELAESIAMFLKTSRNIQTLCLYD